MSERPVFGLDLDGTMGDFYPHFLNFAEGWLGKPVDREYDIRLPLFQHLHVSKQTYRQCKLAYRMGGMKRSMPAFPWAADLTRTLRSWGTDVWVCTTRPYLSHDNIDGDTRHWLRRNGIQCQGIVWGEHKYRDLARTLGKERVVTVLDDLPEMLVQAGKALDVWPVMAVRPHNARAWAANPSTYQALNNYEDIAYRLEERLEKWRDSYGNGHPDNSRARALPHQRRASDTHRSSTSSSKSQVA